MSCRILWIYIHPKNIQRLKRFPPVAAFIPFGGKKCLHKNCLESLFLSASTFLLISIKFALRAFCFVLLWWPLNDLNAVLSSLNRSGGWPKTIFSIQSHPTENEWITTERVPRCQNICALLFHTDNKATEKKRALTSFSLLWPNWLSTHRTTVGFYD